MFICSMLNVYYPYIVSPRDWFSHIWLYNYFIDNIENTDIKDGVKMKENIQYFLKNKVHTYNNQDISTNLILINGNYEENYILSYPQKIFSFLPHINQGT